MVRAALLSGIAVAVLLGACGRGGVSGTYSNDVNGIVFDFKGDKVTMTVAGESQTYDYAVHGDTVTIVNPIEGDIHLTKNSDGSLNAGMFGPVRKR